MPPVAVAVGAAAAAYGATAAAAASGLAAGIAGAIGIAGITTSTILSGIGFLAFTAVSFLGNSLVGKSSKPDQPAFDATAQGRLITARNPVATQKLIYGQVRVGGTTVFMASHASTGSDQPNSLLYLVIALAGHEVQEIGDIYFDDVIVPLTPSGVGFIPAGSRFDGTKSSTGEPWVYIEKYTGAADQAASALLVGAGVGWTAAHRGQGIAYLMLRLVNSVDIWPTGVPNITAVVRGKTVYDPRTATTGWSDNWALCQADYLTDTKFGLSAVYADEIDETALIAAANASDEIVTITSEAMSGASDGITLDLRLTTERTPRIGERFTINSATYYVSGVTAGQAPSDGVRRYRVNFAASLSAARGAQVTSIASGTIAVTRTGEPRFTCNGLVDAGRPRRDVIEELRSAGAGAVVFAGGVWRILAGVWRAPTVTLDAGDLRGPLRFQTKLSARDGGNGVKGVFADPSALYQPTDYPGVTNATYVTADNGEENWRDLDLPFTTSSAMAQRLAKIALERLRRPINGTFPFKLTAFRIAAGDVINLSLDRYGWDDPLKTFEVQNWKLAVYQDDQGNPTLGVDLTLRELDSNAFAWTSNEEATLPAAPATNLPNPFTLAAPGVPNVTEDLYETRSGRGVAGKATMTWAAPEDGFVELYQPEYRLTSASAWTVLPRQESATIDILDIAPGVYQFRVKAINALGVSSSYATRTQEIVGLGAKPANVSGLTASVISSIVLLQWTAHPDLDVKIGGHLWVRWSPAASGATWDAAIDVGEKVDGNLTLALVPAKSGTYLVKAVDSSGNTSAVAATAVVVAGSHFGFTTLSTITESTTFPGAKTDVAVDSSKLHLTGNTLVDAIADWDTVADLDIEGGISATGTYLFNSGYDAATVGTHRISFSTTVAVVNTLDTVDGRGAPIDSWESFDGAVTAAAGVKLYVRQTDDDPAGTPTWSNWQRVSPIGDFHARAYEFKADLFTNDPAYDVEISALSVTIEKV